MTFRTRVLACGSVLLLTVAVCFGVGTPPTASQALPPQTSEPSKALTPLEARGKALYLRGETASGVEINAQVGELDVPASTLTCAGCHGARAEGKTEGGVTAGALTWTNLVKPYGHTHPTNRKHGPFSEASFASAVIAGVDPDGNKLLMAMPRYKMAAADMTALIAYLKRIEFDRDPGITENSIRIGAILPTKGPLAESGSAMKDALAAYFADVNEQGGIYNRKIELQVVDAAEILPSTSSSRASNKHEQIFAFVGGLIAGSETEISAFVRGAEVPLVGAMTLLPQTETPPNRQVFYILPGVAEQARALVNFATSKPESKNSRTVILFTETVLTTAAATAAEDQARKSGLVVTRKQAYAQGTFDAANTAQTLKQQGANLVFHFGSGDDSIALLKEAAAIGWNGDFFLTGVMSASDLPSAVPPTFKGRVFVSFPTVPTDITPAGLAEFSTLRIKFKLTPRHTASQLSALAAGKIFVESLKRAGHDLTRERLIVALEGLYDYETGFTPNITFGPNRRIGAAGSYIVTIDTEKKRFVSASGWINAH